MPFNIIRYYNGLTMKNAMSTSVGISLSMFMTFLFHCALDKTRASGFFFQNLIADPMRDHILALRCLFNFPIGKYRSFTDY